MRFFEDLSCSGRCKGYIDNNTKLHGENIIGYSQSYPITSLKMALQDEFDNVAIIITSLYFKDILSQIESVKTRKYVTCMSVCETAVEQLLLSDYSEIIRETDQPIIPKVIHYAWFGKKMPDKIKYYVDSWSCKCPEFKIKRWDETNYDISKNKFMLQSYDAKIWGFVSDYLRLGVIYKEGGIYLDTDVEIVRDLEPLTYQECFGCIDATLTLNTGSGFGAVPKHEMIRELRDYYDNVSLIQGGKINGASCNTYNYHVLRKHGFRIGDQFQRVNGMNIYPMIFQGVDQFTRTRRITEKTFFLHYGSLSWL